MVRDLQIRFGNMEVLVILAGAVSQRERKKLRKRSSLGEWDGIWCRSGRLRFCLFYKSKNTLSIVMRKNTENMCKDVLGLTKRQSLIRQLKDEYCIH